MAPPSNSARDGPVLVPAAAHVVVISLPVHGHLNPLLQLSVKLAAMGITVSFLTTQSSMLERIPGLLSSAVEDDDQQKAVDKNLMFLSLFDGDEPRVEGEEAILTHIMFMHRKAGEIDELARQAAREYGPICYFILDALVAIPPLQEFIKKRQVPQALFFTASAAFMLISFNLRKLVQTGYAPLTQDNAEKTFNASIIPGIPELSVASDLPYAVQEEPPYDPGFTLRSTVREQTLGASVLLLNTFQELEDDAICSMQQDGVKILTVGPLLPRNVKPKNSAYNRIFDWLDSKPAASVVFVCFGSMKAMSDSRQVEELAYGLQASKHFFLWILSDKLKSDLPEDFENQIADQGLIAPWCPQLQVLRHPSIGAFVTHCGWNSILEGITSGIPMLGWPCMAEQNLNCKYLADVWGIGCRVHTQPKTQQYPVAKNRIEALVRGVMGSEGDHMRKRVAEWRDAARRATGMEGSSTRNVKELAQLIKAARQCPDRVWTQEQRQTI